MSRLFPRIAAVVFLATGVHAQPAVTPMDFTRYERRAGEVFDPKLVTDSTSAFATATDNLLLISQAVAAIVVVAGMIAKIRKDQVQMEGIASMMLKVAFIALVPMLRVHTLETAELAASAIGYQGVSSGGTPSPMASGLWGLLREWAPPGSPFLDALETQGAAAPGSGAEEDWSLHASNWARGVGTTTSGLFDAVWQAVSGGMRAGAVFGACGAMACASSVALTLAYLSEVLRYLLFFAGCALLPVFIAALGIDTMRSQAVRFIVFLVAIACWPVGWGLANGVTTIMARGLIAWINSTSAAALAVGPGDPVLPLSIAAPYVGWGALFLFMGATIAICLWVVGTVVYAPFAVGKLVSSGANAAALLVGSGEVHAASHASGPRTVATSARASVRPERVHHATVGAADSVASAGSEYRAGYPHAAATRGHAEPKTPAMPAIQAAGLPAAPWAGRSAARPARIAPWLPTAPPGAGSN